MKKLFSYLGSTILYRRARLLGGTAPSERPPVLLVHGLLHRACLLESLGEWLLQQGYDVWYFDYPSTRRRVPEFGRILADAMEQLAEQRGAFDLVTHSMGGLLARVALDELDKRGELTFVRRAVFLAPPNRGSTDADWWLKRLPSAGKIVHSLPDLSAGPNAPALRLPLPMQVKFGIIAARFDRRVSLASTRLEGAADQIVLNAGHAWMMNVPVVRQQLLHFLKNGRFAR